MAVEARTPGLRIAEMSVIAALVKTNSASAYRSGLRRVSIPPWGMLA